MLSVCEAIKRVKGPSIVIDNVVFRLHYQFTVGALIAFSLLVASKQFFGRSIDCIGNSEYETYCWIHGTFTQTEALQKEVGKEVPYPGVDKYKQGDSVVYHNYYQWVCYFLLFQAILFYLPRFLWKKMEDRRMVNLVQGLNLPILKAEDRERNRHLLVEYLNTHMYQHNWYVIYYVIIEMLNFAHVVGQIFFVDTFLNGAFLTYGTKVVEFAQMKDEERIDPMIQVFPRMTKCKFYKFGRSGDIQLHDVLCVLPLNIVNEKIFVFLWFWFVILAILSGIVVGYRLLTIISPRLRFAMLKWRARLANSQELQTVMHYTGWGDWFIIYLVTKNIDPLNARDLMHDISKSLERKGSSLHIDDSV